MKNAKTISYWIIILLIILIPFIYLGNNPGLYLDAITPDYAAVQILHPSEHSVNWFVAFPILCAMYHGCINVLISLITVGISGHASVLQHHLTNGIIVFFIILLLDKLLQKHHVSDCIRRIGLLFVATLPTLMTFSLTQYYIELPGCILLLLATLFYEKSTEQKHTKVITISLCFFFLGLAFYSYFNFLFFFPGFEILCLMQANDVLSKIDIFIIACYSFACGSVLYFIGYSMIFLNQTNHSTWIIPCGITIFMFVYGISALVLRSYIHNNKRIPRILTAILVLIAAITLIIIAPTFLRMYSDIGVMGQPTNFLNRFVCLYQIIYETITGTSAEKLIYGDIRSHAQWTILLFTGLICVLFILLAIKKKFSFKKDLILQFLFVLLVYCVCCIPFITHMHTQHFIPIAIWILFITLLEIDTILHAITKVPQYIIPIIFSIFIALNCWNQATIARTIKTTGGTGLYTNQINILAEEALEKADAGYKEAYLFPEWGFLCGFDYLTQNTIAFSDTADTATVKMFLNEGYTIQLLYWNYNDTDKYLAILDGLDVSIELKEYSLANKQGVAFIRMQLSQN